MNGIKVFPIGKIVSENNGLMIKLDPAYKEGLLGIKGYSHIKVLWWMDRCDNPSDRSTLVEDKPYAKGPERIGVFALRSPERPNPIAVSNVEVSFVEEKEGIIGLHYIDAFPGSLVIDIKPYIPSIDRVESSSTPSWCSHWPKSYEESSSFDWAGEFNF